MIAFEAAVLPFLPLIGTASAEYLSVAINTPVTARNVAFTGSACFEKGPL
jgi:hypothetical protein